MSGGFTVSPERPTNGWRQRGYQHGLRGITKTPPTGADERAAYLSGYRRGDEARKQREQDC